MRYDDKKYALGSVTRRKTPLTDFGGYDPDYRERSLPHRMCDEVFNFAFERGKLTDPASFAPFERTCTGGAKVAVPPLTAFRNEDNIFAGKLKIDGVTRDVLFSSDAQSLRYLVLDDEDATWQTASGSLPVTYVSAVNYVFDDDDLMLFGGNGQGVFIFSGSEGGETVAGALPIRAICSYRERVFAVVETQRPCVWFSDTFDPYDWSVSLDAGGYIYTDGAAGKVQSIVQMGDHLFIVCEYGLYRLTAYAEQASFTLKRIGSDTGRIFANGVAVCNDALVFAAKDGIYGCDGYGVDKLTDRADKLLAKAKDLSAVYWRGKYIAEFTDDGESVFRHDAGQENNAMFSLDLDDGGIDIVRKPDVRGLTVLRGSADNALIARSTEDGTVLAASEKSVPNVKLAYWHIGGVDFDLPCAKKRIVEIECRTSAPLTLGVVADGTKHEYAFSPAVSRRLIGVAGREFEFYIVSRAPTITVCPPLVTVDIER